MAELLVLAPDPHPGLKWRDVSKYQMERNALAARPRFQSQNEKRKERLAVDYHATLFGAPPEPGTHPMVVHTRVLLMLQYVGFATYHRERELDKRFMQNLAAAKELRNDLGGYHPETRHMLELLTASPTNDAPPAARKASVKQKLQHTPHDSASGYLISILATNTSTKFTDLEIAALVHEKWPGSCYERTNMIVWTRRRLKIGKCKGNRAIDSPQFKEPLR